MGAAHRKATTMTDPCVCGAEGHYRCSKCKAHVCRVCVYVPYPGGVYCAACGKTATTWKPTPTRTAFGDRTGD